MIIFFKIANLNWWKSPNPLYHIYKTINLFFDNNNQIKYNHKNADGIKVRSRWNEYLLKFNLHKNSNIYTCSLSLEFNKNIEECLRDKFIKDCDFELIGAHCEVAKNNTVLSKKDLVLQEILPYNIVQVFKEIIDSDFDSDSGFSLPKSPNNSPSHLVLN